MLILNFSDTDLDQVLNPDSVPNPDPAFDRTWMPQKFCCYSSTLSLFCLLRSNLKLKHGHQPGSGSITFDTDLDL